MGNKISYQSYISWQQDTVVIHRVANCKKGERKNNGKNLILDKSKAYKGEVTEKNQKRVKTLINNWCQVISAGNKLKKTKHIKLTLLTCTLSSAQQLEKGESDKELKAKLLEPFLKHLKYNYNVVNYFWKAESQKNGNIHFHILIDRYIDKIEVQKVWNRLQDKLNLLRDYKRKYNKENPPSTKIQLFTMNEKGIDYLIKYLTKENEYRKIEGLQLRFSNAVSQLKKISQAIEQSEYINLIELLEKHSVWQHYDEYFMVFKFDYLVDDVLRLSDVFTNQSLYNRIAFEIMYVLKLNDAFISLLNLRFTNIYLYNYNCALLVEKGLNLQPFLELLDKYKVNKVF